MKRMVLLEHTLGDGTRHFDWLIEPFEALPKTETGVNPDDERCIITFRVMDRVDMPRIVAFAADRLPEHRRLYLRYQGEIDGGKGRVRRISAGVVTDVEIMPGAISISGQFNRMKPYTWAGMQDGDMWTFQRSKARLEQRRIELPEDDGDPTWRHGISML